MSRSTFVLVASALIVALSVFAVAQQSPPPAANNPLVELLQAKGIISPQEAATVNQATSAEEANSRLAQLLVGKGLISEQEYKATFTSTASSGSTAQLINAVYRPEPTTTSNLSQPAQAATTAPTSSGPAVIPAVAPLRVLPLDVPKQAGMIPDIKLGSGANMKIYGFYKASAVSDTASSGGPTFGAPDWPLPLLLADTGTNSR